MCVCAPHHAACGILVPRQGSEPAPPAVEAQNLNRWTTREVPKIKFKINKCSFILIHFQSPPPTPDDCNSPMTVEGKGIGSLKGGQVKLHLNNPLASCEQLLKEELKFGL